MQKLVPKCSKIIGSKVGSKVQKVVKLSWFQSVINYFVQKMVPKCVISSKVVCQLFKRWFQSTSFCLLQIAYVDTINKGEFFHLLAIPSKERLLSVLKYMLDEEEFLSPYGIRSLSKVHRQQPFEMHVGDEKYDVGYVPGESNTYVFGGNSNWRGPIWLCGECVWLCGE